MTAFFNLFFYRRVFFCLRRSGFVVGARENGVGARPNFLYAGKTLVYVCVEKSTLKYLCLSVCRKVLLNTCVCGCVRRKVLLNTCVCVCVCVCGCVRRKVLLNTCGWVCVCA